jgi:hypothetical protein
VSVHIEWKRGVNALWKSGSGPVMKLWGVVNVTDTEEILGQIEADELIKVRYYDKGEWYVAFNYHM